MRKFAAHLKTTFTAVSAVLFTVIIGIGLSACSFGVADDLAGTSWVLDSWADETLSPEEYGITLKFGNDGSASGQTSVNSYGGEYKVKRNNELVLNNLAATEMASMDAARNQAESIYLKLIAGVKYYEISDGKLLLKDKDKSNVLTYHSVPFSYGGK
ncbi:MAG: META domain-containing protein [Clostridiales bacterium]|nr:META domain-containing protein [Clostridiales bacterium]